MNEINNSNKKTAPFHYVEALAVKSFLQERNVLCKIGFDHAQSNVVGVTICKGKKCIKCFKIIF